MTSVIRRVVFAALLFMAATAFAGEYLDKVAAVVNGEIITLYDLNERVDKYFKTNEGALYNKNDPAVVADLRDKMLHSMIDDLLLTQEAARLKINVTDTDIEKELQNMMRKNNMTQKQFDEEMAREGLTRKELMALMRKDITKQQILSFMVQRKILVTDEELKNAGANPVEAKNGQAGQAQAAPAQTVEVEGVRVGLIILPKPETAKEVRKKILSKEMSFAEAARRYSVGPAKNVGGDLGFIAFKDMSPDLLAAAKGLAPGSVSDVVTLDGKPALVSAGEVTKEAVSGPSSLSGPRPLSASEGTYENLYKAKAEKQFQDYMAKLRSRAIIEMKM
ncbi:MAG: SurA N-terminal domain-containing protein [Desulfovibrionaceae bacterium]|nr:SurA N-terminal domain-containing protein [Desulfovibrionaceae bacterium]MBF0513605.1 SurA N-terminal domain-containing protein [Desulfovibrionaceae bacterium]